VSPREALLPGAVATHNVRAYLDRRPVDAVCIRCNLRFDLTGRRQGWTCPSCTPAWNDRGLTFNMTIPEKSKASAT
jgi:hypothetical protein